MSPLIDQALQLEEERNVCTKESEMISALGTILGGLRANRDSNS